jgi:hypothetical protein
MYIVSIISIQYYDDISSLMRCDIEIYSNCTSHSDEKFTFHRRHVDSIRRQYVLHRRNTYASK